jgi:GT2 family glycosyltransferase
MIKIAVLLTCHNRKDQTLECLTHFESAASQIESKHFDFYFVDDGSTDGTSNAVKEQFPKVNIIEGDGSLFWAGGMRLAWETSIATNTVYDCFLLLNDDTLIFQDGLFLLFSDLEQLKISKVILVGSTLNRSKDKLTYGGKRLISYNNPASKWIIPSGVPEPCDLGNANIMLVTRPVVDDIGILSSKFTHGIADYDYTLRAKSANIPVYITSGYLGVCENDHGNNWLPANSKFKARLNYMYSVKGLAYHEYLTFIRTHFPNHYLIAKLKLWLKTLFPVLWDKFK